MNFVVIVVFIVINFMFVNFKNSVSVVIFKIIVIVFDVIVCYVFLDVSGAVGYRNSGVTKFKFFGCCVIYVCIVCVVYFVNDFFCMLLLYVLLLCVSVLCVIVCVIVRV